MDTGRGECIEDIRWQAEAWQQLGILHADVEPVQSVEVRKHIACRADDILPQLVRRFLGQGGGRFDDQNTRAETLPVVPQQHGPFVALHVDAQEVDHLVRCMFREEAGQCADGHLQVVDVCRVLLHRRGDGRFQAAQTGAVRVLVQRRGTIVIRHGTVQVDVVRAGRRELVEGRTRFDVDATPAKLAEGFGQAHELRVVRPDIHEKTVGYVTQHTAKDHVFEVLGVRQKHLRLPTPADSLSNCRITPQSCRVSSA